MQHLTSMQMCALITTGRTGSDFLQSLCDSHPQIITFNGILWLHNFWEESLCTKDNDISLNDLLTEFVGKNLAKFKSKYDTFERKDALGNNGDQCIDIDINQYKEYVYYLLNHSEINSRNFLLAVYGAYSLSLNQDIRNKKIIIHHIHHAEKLPPFLKDFPNAKIICMTRDPRANFVSGVTHWRKFNDEFDHAHHLYNYLKRIFIDAYSIKQFKNDYIVIKVEDLGKKSILVSFCNWLQIDYDESLKLSSWGGLAWLGDRCSEKTNEGTGWSSEMLDNSWEMKLRFFDKYILNFLMNSRLKHYEYDYKKINFVDYLIVFLIIPVPLTFERRYFTLKYIINSVKNKLYKKILKNLIYYPKRIIYFYFIYFGVISGFSFNSRYLK